MHRGKCWNWSRLAGLVLTAGVLAHWSGTPVAAQTRERPSTLRLAAVEDSPQAVIADGRVTLEVENAPLAGVLQELVRAGAPILYSSDLVTGIHSVTCHCSDVTLTAALETLLRGTGTTYREVAHSGQILLEPEPEPKRVPVRQGTITGRVTSAETGAGLSGINVALEGIGIGMTTDPNGRYRLAGVPAGTYRITAGSIGYRQESREVTVVSGETFTVDFSLALEAVSLPEVVVTTGTVLETSVRELPHPITVVTEEEIERLGMDNIPEILRVTVPGMVYTDEGPGATYGRFFVRGATSLNGAASRMKVYVDGIEVADATNITQLEPSLVERIEVLSGPQASTIYGSRAIGGVIQVFTKRGSGVSGLLPEVSGRAALRAAESPYVNGTPVGHEFGLTVAGRGEHLSYELSGNIEDAPEWLELYQRQNTDLFGGANFDYGRFSAALTVQHRSGHDEPDWNPLYRRLYREVGQVYDPPTRVTDRRYKTYGATVSFDATPQWRHTFRAGYNTYAGTYYDRTPGPDSLYSISVRNYERWSAAYNTALEMSLGQDVGATLTLGGDYTEYVIPAVSFEVADRGDYDVPEAEELFPRSDAGIFAQTQLGLRNSVFLTAGLRGDRNPNGSNDEFTWSPRVGLSAVDDFGALTVKARVAWGQSLVIPEDYQVVADESESTVTLASPDLKAEIQRGYDLGLDLYHGTRASLSVTYFNQSPLNLIVSTNTGQDEQGRWIWDYENLQAITNKGWELEGMIRPNDRLTLQGSYGRTTSRIKELGPDYTGDLEVGGQLHGLPEYTASGSAVFTPFGGTTMNASIFRYGSWEEQDLYGLRKDQIGGTFNPDVKPFSEYFIIYPAFTKFNVGITQELSERLTGYLRIDNAGNSDAFEHGNLSPPPPRTFTFGVRFSGL